MNEDILNNTMEEAGVVFSDSLLQLLDLEPVSATQAFDLLKLNASAWRPVYLPVLMNNSGDMYALYVMPSSHWTQWPWVCLSHDGGLPVNLAGCAKYLPGRLFSSQHWQGQANALWAELNSLAERLPGGQKLDLEWYLARTAEEWEIQSPMEEWEIPFLIDAADVGTWLPEKLDSLSTQDEACSYIDEIRKKQTDPWTAYMYAAKKVERQESDFVEAVERALVMDLPWDYARANKWIGAGRVSMSTFIVWFSEVLAKNRPDLNCFHDLVANVTSNRTLVVDALAAYSIDLQQSGRYADARGVALTSAALNQYIGYLSVDTCRHIAQLSETLEPGGVASTLAFKWIELLDA